MKNFWPGIALGFLIICPCNLAAQVLPTFEPTWYVGDTQAGEWIRFQEIYLSPGEYRFTGHLGASKRNAQVELLVRSNAADRVARLGPFSVPKQDTSDSFELVHLGKLNIKQAGNYDIVLRFLSDDVSADFVYIRKSSAPDDRVLPDDVAAPAPVHDGRTRVTPIGPYSTPSDQFTFLDYSPEQCMAWYRQACHIGLDREDSIRSGIETAISARLDWCWLHGRAAKMKPEWDWGIDRESVPNPGELPGHRLKPYFEVLETIPHAKHLRYSYFCDNVFFGKFFSNNHDGKEARWEDPEFQEFIWNNWIRAWYDHIPPERHMINENGRIFLYFWTADCGVKGKQVLEFLVDLKSRLRDEFQLEVDFLLPGGFAKKDPRVEKLTYAQPPWFYWNQQENVHFKEFQGKTLGFATNGRKLPINCIWDLDWNPDTGVGTRVKVDKYPDDAHARPTHIDGKSTYELGLREANQKNAKWVLLESWSNRFEGSTWFRSDHPDYRYPNEFINITRKFADESTAAIMLQAEAYDMAHDLSPGNEGKAYRYNWHTSGEPDVDIFRPLHQISGLRKSEIKRKLRGIAAGAFDVWAVDIKGESVANEVDGNAKWKPAKSQGLKFERLSLGKRKAWSLAEGTLYAADLPRGWDYFNCGKWQAIQAPAEIKEICAGPDKTVWCIDGQGSLWNARNTKQKESDASYAFQHVDCGQALRAVGVGQSYLWALTEKNKLLRRSVDLKGDWQAFSVSTPIQTISVGSSEVWILTKRGAVYRMPESGSKLLEYVTRDISAISLGRNFCWLVKSDGSVWWARLHGFASTKVTKSLRVTRE